MRLKHAMVCAAVVGFLCCATAGQGADKFGLKEGTPDLKSAGPLAFGPDGILLVGDTQGAAIFAVASGDTSGQPQKVELNVNALNEKVAKLLGASPQAVHINDLAVNPLSGNAYLSVSQGGADATPALVRVDSSGKLSQLSLENVPFAKVTLPNPPEDKVVGEGRRRRNRRSESITDLAFVEGRVIVSGLSSDESPSNVRSLDFPFSESNRGMSLAIFHGAHGRVEDYAAIRTFVPFNIAGEPNLLAGFTCTPLVKFPLKNIVPGKKMRGTTVAELGNRNRPLDMIVYKKDGKDFLLLANSSRGVMKVSTDDIESQKGITEKISGGGTAGQPYETIKQLEGVVQLDRLNDNNALVLVQNESGALDLQTVPLP